MAEADIAALQAALDAQTAMQRETDHRVKNTLQLISSLLLLQGRRSADPASRAALKAALQRVSAVSVAARYVERPAGAEETDVCALVREIAIDLASGMGREDVAVDLDLEPMSLPARYGGPVALILSEALSNALVHAFPNGRGGRVQVALQRAADGFVLSVSDDGVGAGGGSPAKGFGLTIAQLMAQQLRGRLETRATQPGISLTVHVPMDVAPP